MAGTKMMGYRGNRRTERKVFPEVSKAKVSLLSSFSHCSQVRRSVFLYYTFRETYFTK